MPNYLLNLMPYADGILSNCKDQLTFDDMQDVQHFIAHYAGYCESITVHEKTGTIYGMDNYNANPIFEIGE